MENFIWIKDKPIKRPYTIEKIELIMTEIINVKLNTEAHKHSCQQ